MMELVFIIIKGQHGVFSVVSSKFENSFNREQVKDFEKKRHNCKTQVQFESEVQYEVI